MPFQKGNQLAKGAGGGRKGYEIENQELKTMTSLFRRYLTLAEKIESGRATTNQKDAFERLKALVLKIMDKLHPNKEAMDITTLGKELPQPILSGITNVHTNNGTSETPEADKKN